MYPLLLHIIWQNFGCAGVYLFFSFLLQSIDCGYLLEPPQRAEAVLTYTHNLCLSKNKKNIKNFIMKIFNFHNLTIFTIFTTLGYNLNVMRQSACLVFNPIMVDNYAAFFNCTPVGRASDSMMAPT